MAKCPECGCSQEWGKLFSLNNYSVIVCPSCNTQLQYNRKRYSIILGVFFVVFMLPLTPFVDIELNHLWLLTVAVPFSIVWITLIKLERAETNDVTVTGEQKCDFNIYAKKRRKLNIKLISIVILVMSIWFVATFVLDNSLGEYTLIFFLLVMLISFLCLMVTRCPYCNKLTPNMPICGNCKREIDIR